MALEPGGTGSLPDNGVKASSEISEIIDTIYLDTTPAVDEGVCKKISKKILEKETSLLKVVEELGPRLTSTHARERAKAVEILALVFTHISSDYLSESELSFIVDFLCDRCKDQHLVMPKIIMCVLPIVKCTNLPAGAGAKLLENLFRDANVQSHIHKIRHTFFQTLQVLLADRLEEIQNMSSDFVMNFLQAMDGEKDPRNLLLLFRIIPMIISHFKLDPFTEDFFEILSCYFPIDFNPTVAIPGEEVITRKDLAHALHIGLSQTNEFSEFLVPLIMEKLESHLMDAKLDALELLQLCCERSYQPADAEPHLSQIWHGMRREIFMGGNDEVEKKCYQFLKSAFTMLSKNDSILTRCLSMIYTECKHHLTEPELRLIVPTSNILRCITESSPAACSSVVQNMFPVFYDQVCVKSSVAEKRRLLGIWETLISTSRQFREVEFHALLPTWDEMRGLWFTLLTNDDWEIVTVVLKIFSHVIVLESDFQKDQRNMLQEHLLRLIRSNSFSVPQNARLAVISLSCSICKVYGEEYTETSIPRLLNTLTHSSTTGDSLLCDNKCEDQMHCQAKALSCKVLADSSHLHYSCFQKVVSYMLDSLRVDPFQFEFMSCLASIVENASKDKPDGQVMPNLSSIFTSMSILDSVISIAQEICKTSKAQEESSNLMTVTDAAGKMSVIKVPRIIEGLCYACSIIRNLMRTCLETEQAGAINMYWNMDVTQQSDIFRRLTDTPGLLIEALLGPCRPPTSISFKRELMNCILNDLLASGRVDSICTQVDGDICTLPLIRLLGSIINKVEEGHELAEHLNDLENHFEKLLQPCSSNDELEPDTSEFIAEKREDNMGNQANLINALMWIVKGLAMRGSKELDAWVVKIMLLLKDDTLGEEVVKHFPNLVADDPYSLNPESFCRFRFLYKQRLFDMTVDKLVSGYRSASSQPIQFNFIRALSSQLKHVPSEILFTKIDSVLPLLVASLKCNSSSQVLLSSLNAISEMMHSQETKPKLMEYTHDLIPQLTRLAQYKDSMDVRIISLSCLRHCAKTPAHVILPLREAVIFDLVPCLDDSKRLVRKEASLTRNIWMLIGAPGGL